MFRSITVGKGFIMKVKGILRFPIYAENKVKLKGVYMKKLFFVCFVGLLTFQAGESYAFTCSQKLIMRNGALIPNPDCQLNVTPKKIYTDQMKIAGVDVEMTSYVSQEDAKNNLLELCELVTKKKCG